MDIGALKCERSALLRCRVDVLARWEMPGYTETERRRAAAGARHERAIAGAQRP